MVRPGRHNYRPVPVAGLFLIFCVLAPSVFSEELSVSWRFPAAGRITGICSGQEGEVVYFLCEDRSMYALSARGTPLWKSRLGSQVTPFIEEGPDGTVYAALLDGSLVAVNPRGRIIWQVEDIGPVSGPVTCSPGGVVYITTLEGRVHSLSHTGRRRWSVETGAVLTGSPRMIGTNRIVVTSRDGTVMVIDSWGDTVWKERLGSGFTEVVYSRFPMISYTGIDGTVQFYSMTGKLLFDYKLGSSIGTVREAYPEKGGVVVVSRGRRVYRVTEKGVVTLLGTLPDSASGLLGVTSRNTLLGFERRGAIILNSEGELKRLTVTGNVIGPPVPVSQNLIAWGGEDWILYAVSLESPLEEDFVEQTVLSGDEDIYASLESASFNYRYLMYLVESNELEDKEKALEELKTIVMENQAGMDREYAMYLLTRLASQGVIETVEEGGRLVNNFPQIRSGAVELLGRHGDFQTRDFLLRLMRYEFDSYALAMEAWAVGELKSDPNGRTGEVFNLILQRQLSSGPDNTVALEMIRAIGKISNYHGSIDERSVDTLFAIFRGAYSKRVRSMALRALEGVGK